VKRKQPLPASNCAAALSAAVQGVLGKGDDMNARQLSSVALAAMVAALVPGVATSQKPKIPKRQPEVNDENCKLENIAKIELRARNKNFRRKCLHVAARSNPANRKPGEVAMNENASPIRCRRARSLLGWLFFSVEAQAAIDSTDVFDNVLARYSAAASMWAGNDHGRASWLFWTLALISMVWTFGMMALRKADIGEFFAEFVRFTIFTGFFWWLLTNGPNFATDHAIAAPIGGRQAAQARRCRPPASSISALRSSTRFSISPRSGRRWIAFGRHPHGVGILIILALIGVNMLAAPGVGLGAGLRRRVLPRLRWFAWTSDMAINYYKTVLGVAAQLMTMVLLVGIGKTFLSMTTTPA
jgi:entry exclusion lipoprotein TrbK